MNELSNTKLIGLLSDASLVTNEEMHNAYEDFIDQVSAGNSNVTAPQCPI